jgi:nuclear transport factor 2 (NTF2) superfamily protein
VQETEQQQPETKPPVPPFTEETARQKVKMAEDAWNTRDPERVALAYTENSVWRNRDEFFEGREEIKAFLRRKWSRELDYRLMKELWCTRVTVSRCASSTRATTKMGSGGAAMGTSTGSSTKTG